MFEGFEFFLFLKFGSFCYLLGEFFRVVSDQGVDIWFCVNVFYFYLCIKDCFVQSYIFQNFGMYVVIGK